MLRDQRKKRCRWTWPPLTPTPVGEARQEATREALPGSCTTLGGLRRKLRLGEPWMEEVEGSFKTHLVSGHAEKREVL